MKTRPPAPPNWVAHVGDVEIRIWGPRENHPDGFIQIECDGVYIEPYPATIERLGRALIDARDLIGIAKGAS